MATRPDPRHLPRRAGKGEAKESRYEIPIVSQAPSSRGFFAFSGDRDRDRVIAVTKVDSREQAMCAHEQVLAIMREKGKVAPNPRQGAARRTSVLATA